VKFLLVLLFALVCEFLDYLSEEKKKADKTIEETRACPPLADSYVERHRNHGG
jgi:hypothetical protein